MTILGTGQTWWYTVGCLLALASRPFSVPTHAFPSGAANRFPDQCDTNPNEAREINVEASKCLARATSSKNILLIYVSTDYVFPGRPGDAPYEANSSPEPTNLYGQTKLDGERAILEATKETGLGVVLRVPVLYGKAEEPKESAVNILMDVVWESQKKYSRTKMDDVSYLFRYIFPLFILFWWPEIPSAS